MTTQQPEALRLAVSSSAMADEGEMIHLLSWYEIRNLLRADAAELRRLHTENTALQQGYAAARLEIESLQSRIKTMAEEHADELMVAHMDGRSQAAQQPAPSAAVALSDDLRDRLVAISEAVADQDDRAAQAMLREILKAPQPSPTPQADSQPAPDEATAMSRTGDLAEAGRWPSDWVEAYRRGYSDRASSAPADSALKDHQIAALVNELRDIAVEFHGTQQLRERIARVVVPALKAKTADSVLEDAARWKMAVLVGNEVMMHPEKRTHPAAVKAYMDAVHSGLDLTGAIDAARKQGANHD